MACVKLPLVRGFLRKKTGVGARIWLVLRGALEYLKDRKRCSKIRGGIQ